MMIKKCILFLLFFSLGVSKEPDFGKWIKVQEGENKIGLLEIGREHPINQATYLYVKFALDYFKKEKADFILLRLDTPGGEVFSALQIAQLLIKIDAEEKIPVVAFIDNWALSAGALLAYSCRYIGIAPTANMGAAEPVIATEEGGMETASEKVISALRAEIANLARLYGRNSLIAEAMVDKDITLVERKGKICKLTSNQEIKSTDQVISQKGKLLSLNAEQLMAYGVADFEIPTLFQEPFFASLPEKKILAYKDWKIHFFAFLSHPAVSSLLLIGLILGIYLEISSAGFGVAGVLAISCLALMLLSSFSIQAIHWLEVILFFLGLLFLALEIFVIPGFGIVGILGILLTLAGLFGMLLPNLEGMKWDFTKGSLGLDLILYHLAWLSFALLVCLLVIALSFRYLPRRKFFLRRFVLEDHQEGFIPNVLDHTLIGKKGIALSDLKPSGHVLVEGKEIQAVSQSKYISKGADVIIIDSKSSYFIVKEISENVSRN